MESPIAGWYPDPSGDTTKHRYWNGEQWTENFRDAVTLAPIGAQAVAQEIIVTDPAAAGNAAVTVATDTPADIIVQPADQTQGAQPGQQPAYTQPNQSAQGAYTQQPGVQQPYVQQSGAQYTQQQPYVQQPYVQQPYTQAPAYTAAGSDNTLLMVAFIFSIIGTVCLAVTIIGLAWGIPMTVHTYKIYKGEKQCTTAFAVCSLLFLSLVSGVLLLVDNHNKKQ